MIELRFIRRVMPDGSVRRILQYREWEADEFTVDGNDVSEERQYGPWKDVPEVDE